MEDHASKSQSGPALSRRRLLAAAVYTGVSAVGLALASSACSLPMATPARIPRIGYLSPGPREGRTEFVDAFLLGLRDLGYVEGQTITVEWCFTPVGSDARFPELVAELVSLPADVIVTGSSTPAALAAKNATSTIPIVAVSLAQPVAVGVVPSLAHPGGNVTALASSTPGTFGKKLEFIQAIVPGLRRLAVLVDRTNPLYDVVGWNEIHDAAEQAGVGAERIDLHSAEDLDTAFETAESRGVDAILTAQNPLLLPVRARVAELELHYRLPGIFEARDYVSSGGLLSYGANYPAIYRRAALYVDRILKGAKPGDLPVEQPTTFEMAVNVRTLQALGLTIPSAVLPLVTEWIP
jgi:ABC-type uncharacterized transport system substrate-binding protein